MTEHSKIPPAGEPLTPADGSLFERASGAFGLEALRAAPVPVRLPGAPMKRARPIARSETVEPGPDHLAPADRIAEAAPTLPVTIAPRPAASTAAIEPAVRFRGERHPIDRAALNAAGIIVPDAPTTALLEEFRIVKRQVLAAAHETGSDAARRVLVCSPHPGEGKTFCAVNLAMAMAGEREGEVVLVDADFAKPSILSTLGLPKGPGLMDALADPSLKIEDLVLVTDVPGLFVLPSGTRTNADSEWLASARTAELMHRLTRGAPARMVVFDSPPALAASPAAELAKHAGQAILVARADQTGRSALEDAIDLLSACPDIKLLLNAAHFSPSGRRFGTYYGYEG